MPTIPLTPAEQILMAASGFLFKPIYMIGSLLVVRSVWRRAEPGLAHIFWALSAFFLAEVCCTVYYYLGNWPLPLEIAHETAESFAAALLSWGFFVHTHERLGASGRPASPHIVGRLLLIVAVLGCLLACIPFALPLRPVEACFLVLGGEYRMSLGIPILWLQFRAFPLAAIACFACFAVASPLLGRGGRRQQAALPWFFFGQGLLLFALVHFFFLEAFRSKPIWADFFEQLIELVVVVGTAAALRVLHAGAPAEPRALARNAGPA